MGVLTGTCIVYAIDSECLFTKFLRFILSFIYLNLNDIFLTLTGYHAILITDTTYVYMYIYKKNMYSLAFVSG